MSLRLYNTFLFDIKEIFVKMILLNIKKFLFMQSTIKGVHGEWNLGSPGGWEYQKMIQEIYLPAWQEIKKISGIDLDLDLDNNYFKPSIQFAELLLRAHKMNFADQDPYIVLVAEEEALDDVVENSRFVAYLNTLDKVTAKMVGPRELSVDGDKVIVEGRQATVVYMDFNTSVLVELEKKYDISGLLKAITTNIMVSPRGMEPIGVKGIFEVIERYQDQLTETTVARTPWTRKFYQRETTGPNGEEISNLIEWTKQHWDRVILKPESGWSGKGIIVCPNDKDIEGGIKKALDAGNYIVQEFVPIPLWTELIPHLNEEQTKVELLAKQTDFRCLVCDQGIMGFLARFGGVPTNVGSGGGVQSLAIIKSDHSVKEAVELLNKTLTEMAVEDVKKIKQGIDQRAIDMNFIYLNGPIPIGLRPRVIDQKQVKELIEYAENLYQDILVLENLWREGKLEDIIKITDREKEIAKMQPRKGPAMLASDGLFDFGAGL